MLFRSLLSMVAPSGQRARLSILIFHRVLSEPDPLFPDEVDCQRFDQMMGWVANWFNVLPLDEAVQRMKTGSLPARSAAITFDDGYSDNWNNAVPVLKKHGLHATFFIASGFLDGGRMWNDSIIEAVRGSTAEELELDWLGLASARLKSIENRREVLHRLIPAVKHLPGPQRDEAVARVIEQCGATLPDDLMLTSAELKALHGAGMTVGAHTRMHPILARTDIAMARREIAEGRDELEALVGERVGLFAYPNGKRQQDYLPEHVDLVREMGFDAAVSTNWGASGKRDDIFQLKRFTPWDKTHGRFALRLGRNIVYRSKDF